MRSPKLLNRSLGLLLVSLLFVSCQAAPTATPTPVPPTPTAEAYTHISSNRSTEPCKIALCRGGTVQGRLAGFRLARRR